MIVYLIVAGFVLSLGIAAGGILLSNHLRNIYREEFFATLVFFQVFWFTFGFYVLWGQVAIVTLLKSLVEAIHLEKITNITVLMGLPFIIFAWLTLLRFAREISGRKTSGTFIAVYLTLNMILIPGTGYLISLLPGAKALTIVKYSFVVLSFTYTAFASFYLLSGKKKSSLLNRADSRKLSFGLFIVLLMQNGVLLIWENNMYLFLVFTIVLFIFGGFIPFYLRYNADLSKLLFSGENELSFDRFCEYHEITRREKEIIHEICSGLSNQQIADRLFISLQTVKDHTHRIYDKTGCSSRVQLIRMVNDTA